MRLMNMRTIFTAIIVLCLATGSLYLIGKGGEHQSAAEAQNRPSLTDSLPKPFATKSVTNPSRVIGWPPGKTPQAPAGFVVTRFAGDLENPRWIYVAPNGDVLIAETEGGGSMHQNNANRITLFRDVNKDGKYAMRNVFLEHLNGPFGMLILGNKFYVANTDAVWEYPYKTGDTKINGTGKKILSLPGNGRHWTRNIIANARGTKIYVSVGSNSDHGEDGLAKETRRADILEINPDGSGERVYASGLRNPVGMDWEPVTHVLWTAVNERDNLGDNLVPDFITSLKSGGFYGWPFCYYGKEHLDPRIKKSDERPDLVAKAIVPDVSTGNHTASLGLVFYKDKAFPARYRGGAFIGQHGSWNRSVFNGYQVAFVPFKNGKPDGPMESFLTGFIADRATSEAYGRPVGVALLPDGSLLVADDAGNTIWRVSANK